MFIRSTGEPVLAQVVGHSEHGDAYRRITAQSIPVESGEHVQEFKVKGSRTKKFYTEPVKE